MLHRLTIIAAVVLCAAGWIVRSSPATAQPGLRESGSARIQQVSDALVLIAPQGDQAMLSITAV